MSILEKVMDRRESSDNVFDFVSKEELGIEENVSLVETPEYLTDPDTDEIRYIESGFAAPPPEDEEIVYEPLAEEEEETHSNNPDDWAKNIVEDIRSNGVQLINTGNALVLFLRNDRIKQTVCSLH